MLLVVRPRDGYVDYGSSELYGFDRLLGSNPIRVPRDSISVIGVLFDLIGVHLGD